MHSWPETSKRSEAQPFGHCLAFGTNRMRSWKLLIALAAVGCAQAAQMSDYRIRGYMVFQDVIGGTACSQSFLVACGQAGQLGLRAAPDSLKVLAPPSGFAVMNNTIIDCPEGIGPITSDSSGNNQQASGVFPKDKVSPSLVPETAYTATPSGSPNGIQIRTQGSQCIYNFQLTQATSYILGVAPVQWISIFGAASARATSPAIMLACSLAAVVLVRALR